MTTKPMPSRSPGRRVGFVVALVLGIAAIAVWWGFPSITARMDRQRMTELLADMRSLQQAISLKILDDSQSGTGSYGLPADIGAKTARAYLEPLVTDGYLERATLDRMLERISVVNVSKSDPAETPFLLDLQEDGDVVKAFVVFRLGGGGGAFKREQDWEAQEALLPKREPQILPKE